MKHPARWLTPTGWFALLAATAWASVLIACLSLMGCSGLNIESRAEATYGSFVALEQSAAQLMQSPDVSDALKTRLQQADAAAKPAAEALLAALLVYHRTHDAAPLNTALDQAHADIAPLARALTPAEGAP